MDVLGTERDLYGQVGRAADAASLFHHSGLLRVVRHVRASPDRGDRRARGPVIGRWDAVALTFRRIGRSQNAPLQLSILEVARLLRPDRRCARDEDQLVGRGQLHDLARGQQRPRRLLPRDHEMSQPRRQPVPGVVLHRAHFRRGAERVGDALCGAFVVRGEGHPDVAIVEDRIVRPVGLLDLVERLGDEETLQPVAGHEGEGALEEVEPPERRELVEHKKQAVLAGLCVQLLRQPPPNLVQDQAHKGLGARDVRGCDDEVERRRAVAFDEVGDAPVAVARNLRHDRIAVEPEKGHGGGEHARAFVVGLVEELTGCAGYDRVRPVAQMRGRQHGPQRPLDRMGRVGEEGRDPGQRLVGTRIEYVQDRPDQQRVAGLLPVVAPLDRAFGIDENVGNVLDIADLAIAAPHLEQRVVGRARRVGRIEQQHAPEAGPPSGGQRPVLALDVVDDGRAGPGQQCRDDEPDALARSGGGEAEHMFRPVVAEIVAFPATQDGPVGRQEIGGADIRLCRPAGRAVGRDVLVLAGAPDAHGNGDTDGREAAGAGDDRAFDEDAGRVGVIPVPPEEEGGRRIDRPATEIEPRRAELRLESETPCRPLRRGPDEQERGQAGGEDLAPENLGRLHAPEQTRAADGSKEEGTDVEVPGSRA